MPRPCNRVSSGELACRSTPPSTGSQVGANRDFEWRLDFERGVAKLELKVLFPPYQRANLESGYRISSEFPNGEFQVRESICSFQVDTVLT